MSLVKNWLTDWWRDLAYWASLGMVDTGSGEIMLLSTAQIDHSMSEFESSHFTSMLNAFLFVCDRWMVHLTIDRWTSGSHFSIKKVMVDFSPSGSWNQKRKLEAMYSSWSHQFMFAAWFCCCNLSLGIFNVCFLQPLKSCLSAFQVCWSTKHLRPSLFALHFLKIKNSKGGLS